MKIRLRDLDMRITMILLLSAVTFFGGLSLNQAQGVEKDTTLGRFFTTKKERISLDFARRKALRKKHLSALKKGKDSVQEYQQTVTLNGFVIRSKGPPAVWINGRTAINEDGNDLPPNLKLTPIGKGHGVSVKLKKMKGKKQVLLKTGQRMDGSSGIVLEPYQGVMQTLREDGAKGGDSSKKKKKKKKKKSTKKKASANISSDEAALNDMISQRQDFSKKLDFMNKLIGQ
ncbi:MAG: hypothetical protein HQL69_10060 [Magnetococcales bacterium]|nr:hypothetical protein [Magnetococcales bacterium]